MSPHHAIDVSYTAAYCTLAHGIAMLVSVERVLAHGAHLSVHACVEHYLSVIALIALHLSLKL